MLRPRSLALLGAALAGCGGSGSSRSSDDGFVPAPTGGGGTIAEYVGAYAGDGYAVPVQPVAAGTTPHTAKLVLAVAEDGTVGGTLTPDGGTTAAFTGTVTDQGAFHLSNGDAGALAKQADGSLVGTLAVPSGGGVGYDLVYCRLVGGAATAAPPPLTTGLVFAGRLGGSEPFHGFWSQPETGLTGTLKLKLSPKGHLTGSWTRSDGEIGAVNGALYDTVASASCFAGTATVRFPDGDALALDLRARDVTTLPEAPGEFLAGSAVQTNGTADYALYLGIG